MTLGVRPDLQFSSNVNFTIAFWIKLPQDYIGGDLPFFCTAKNANFNPGISIAPAYGYGRPVPAPQPYYQHHRRDRTGERIATGVAIGVGALGIAGTAYAASASTSFDHSRSGVRSSKLTRCKTSLGSLPLMASTRSSAK